jgi:hypothetical protein
MNHLARLQQSQRAKLLNRFQPGRKVKKLDEAGVRDAVSRSLLPIALLDDCRQYEQRDLTSDFIKLRESFTRLCDGSADDDNHRQLYIAIQLAALRAEQIDAELAAQFAPALSALSRCKERRKSTSKYDLDGIGMQSVSWAIDVHEEILRHSTPKQMDNCLKKIVKAIDAKTEFGQQVASDIQ